MQITEVCDEGVIQGVLIKPEENQNQKVLQKLNLHESSLLKHFQWGLKI